MTHSQLPLVGHAFNWFQFKTFQKCFADAAKKIWTFLRPSHLIFQLKHNLKVLNIIQSWLEDGRSLKFALAYGILQRWHRSLAPGFIDRSDPKFMLCSFSSSKSWRKKSPEDVIVPKYSPRYGQLTQTTTSIHFLTILSIVLLTWVFWGFWLVVLAGCLVGCGCSSHNSICQ